MVGIKTTINTCKNGEITWIFVSATLRGPATEIIEIGLILLAWVLDSTDHVCLPFDVCIEKSAKFLL